MSFFKTKFRRPAALLLPFCAALLLAGCTSTQPPGEQAAREDAGAEQVHDGFSTRDARDVTGSAKPVTVRDEKRQAAARLSDLLRGQVAGVVVSESNSGISVRIRGTTSIHGSNAPLYVVDGTPVRADAGGALSWINPSDVASITVLKGPETSIYGSRGANGVIVVETK